MHPRAVNRNRRLRRERAQNFLIVLGEAVYAVAFQVQDPDQPPIRTDRRHQLRLGFAAGVDIAHIERNIGDNDALSGSRHPADQLKKGAADASSGSNQLAAGIKRSFLEDGDSLVMRGWCQGDGYRVGFGEVEGTILPAE